MTFRFQDARHARAVLMVVLLAICACALWLSLRSSSDASAADAESAAATAAHAYGALRAAPKQADGASDKPITVGMLAKDMPTVDAARARALTANARRTVALVPRRDGELCLTVFGGNGYAGGACDDAATVATEGIVAGVPGAYVGVVPDGVRAVTFRMSDGTSRSADVKSNLYWPPAEAVAASFDVHGLPQQVEMTPASALKDAAPPGVKVVNSADAMATLAP